jgi:hypothetical protein
MYKDNKYRQLVPEKLLPELKYVEQNPPMIPGFRISYIYEILYWIITKTTDSGYSYLNMIYLKKIIPQGNEYIIYMLSKGFIERSPNYIQGERSYGYRIKDEYKGRNKRLDLTDNKLIRRINRQKNSFAYGYHVQNKLISDFTIDPDAIQFAEATYTGESLDYAIASITMIQNEDRYSTVDTTAGRFHSNLTNLPKELRAFVIIYEKHLTANVDIRNSQPYFSILLLTDPFKTANFTANPELKSTIEAMNVLNNEDVKLYIDLVTNGKFYEYIIPYFIQKGLIKSNKAF